MSRSQSDTQEIVFNLTVIFEPNGQSVIILTTEFMEGYQDLAFDTVSSLVLVDGDPHGDGYVTPIVCKHYNEQTGFWFYLS